VTYLLPNYVMNKFKALNTLRFTIKIQKFIDELIILALDNIVYNALQKNKCLK